MTTTEFRSDSALVKELRAVLDSPIMQDALACMKENGPETKIVDLSKMAVEPSTLVSVQFGRIKGYAEYHLGLKELTTPFKAPVNVRSDYGAKE